MNLSKCPNCNEKELYIYEGSERITRNGIELDFGCNECYIEMTVRYEIIGIKQIVVFDKNGNQSGKFKPTDMDKAKIRKKIEEIEDKNGKRNKI